MTGGDVTGEARPAAAGVGRDTLFAASEGPTADAPVPAFRFDADVVRVFPDMLDRSIPGYAGVVAQTGLLAARFARPHTRLYDLGCSLGASALAMRAALARPTPEAGATPFEGCEIHAIDRSPAMIGRARELVAAAVAATPAEVRAPRVVLHEADLLEHRFERASVAALNFTLQFVPPEARAELLGRVARALVPGGVLVLSEKLRFEDAALDALHTDMHHAFKRANGYSATEIARKRAAIENVLVPDTLGVHRARLAAAGFERTGVWFQCFNFASLVAIRG